jgi:hypothetical protein
VTQRFELDWTWHCEGDAWVSPDGLSRCLKKNNRWLAQVRASLDDP